MSGVLEAAHYSPATGDPRQPLSAPCSFIPQHTLAPVRQEAGASMGATSQQPREDPVDASPVWQGDSRVAGLRWESFVFSDAWQNLEAVDWEPDIPHT